jgi:O-antigen ligase
VLFFAFLAFVVRSRAAIGVAPLLVLLLGWRLFRWRGLVIACIAGLVLATGLWATSQSLREFFFVSIQQAKDYSATNADNSIGEHIEFLRKSMTFVREAPLIGHGTGSIADLFRR